MKTKIIKGRPVYLYRGSQWLEQPEKTIIKSMRYSKEENVTYVKVGHPTIITEVLCILIIAGCIAVNIFTDWGTNLLLVRFNSAPVYYNNNVYINLYNEKSTDTVKYILKTDDSILAEGTLNVGEYKIAIPCEEYVEKCTLVLETKNVFKQTVEDEYKLTVVNKEIRDEK